MEFVTTPNYNHPFLSYTTISISALSQSITLFPNHVNDLRLFHSIMSINTATYLGLTHQLVDAILYGFRSSLSLSLDSTIGLLLDDMVATVLVRYNEESCIVSVNNHLIASVHQYHSYSTPSLELQYHRSMQSSS